MLIHQYKESWTEDFELLKKSISVAFLDVKVSIEHVGSTSVPKLAAKQIIDIDIVYDKNTELEKIKNCLKKIGYQHHGNQGIAQREVFKRSSEAKKHEILDGITHHLYACPTDSEELERHILFRDYLKKNETARLHYQNIKYQIAKEVNQDKKKYAELKEVEASDFINGIIEKAKKEKL